MNLLFMDERICGRTRSVAITGVIVPVEKYRSVREEFYERLEWSIRGEGNRVSQPPELRGSGMPAEWSDGQMLAAFSDVADLVCKHELWVVRVGYRLTKQFRDLFETEDRQVAMCWNGLVSALNPIYGEQLLFPVMDLASSNRVKMTSQTVHTMDWMRHAGVPTFEGSQNLAEVLYASSQHSAMIQIADVLSYLLGIRYQDSLGLDVSEFKRSLLAIVARLDPFVAKDEVVTMRARSAF